jgi:hypothetical protein
VKERAARLGSGRRLQAALLAHQLPTTKEQGTIAPSALALVNGDLGRSSDGELVPGEAAEVACGRRLPGSGQGDGGVRTVEASGGFGPASRNGGEAAEA